MGNNHNNDISVVAASRLCTSCGACLGICPTNAIHFEETIGGYYLPVINSATCNICGLCLKVCPGVHFSDTLIARMPEDPYTGKVLESFVGKAANKEIFDNSQSGGVVSALLIHAMKTGQIKSAVTVSMVAGSPPRPVAYIAKTRNEIIQSQKSKYCPVPLLGFLRNLSDEDTPVAVVGLSCHLHGLYNIMDRFPKLRSKIIFTIGLVCDRVLTYGALDFFIDRSSIDKRSKVMLHFRDKMLSGYPGNVHVFSNDNTSIEIPSSVRIGIRDFFTPARCRLCFDKMNIFADITVGDPHGLDGIDRQKGESMLVTRTDIGENIVKAAWTAQSINIRRIEYKDVLIGQKISRRKKMCSEYMEAWQQLGYELPDCFGYVKKQTYPYVGGKKYQHDILQSLKLDNFPSREDLIRHAETLLRRKHLTRRLLLPVRLAMRILKMIKHVRIKKD